MFTRYLEGVHDYGHESPIVQIMVMSESKNDEDADGGETEVYNFKLKIDRWYRDSYDVGEKGSGEELCDIRKAPNKTLSMWHMWRMESRGQCDKETP